MAPSRVAEDHLHPMEARLEFLGVETLARLFKRYQGETIGRFIMNVRVREAAHLPTHTDATIDEITTRTGFPSRAYLSRAFKNVTEESPAEFRRRYRDHPPTSCPRLDSAVTSER
jgi:transcriptional regulator GlxA family with amidase domain